MWLWLSVSRILESDAGRCVTSFGVLAYHGFRSVVWAVVSRKSECRRLTESGVRGWPWWLGVGVGESLVPGLIAAPLCPAARPAEPLFLALLQAVGTVASAKAVLGLG